MKLNYALIGSVPSMDVFVNSLPRLMAEYEATAPTVEQRAEALIAIKAGQISQAMTNRVTLGVTIGLCAAHFYGIDAQAEDLTITEVIDLVRGLDQDLQSA